MSQIVIAAGGTGGHVFPALAVAEHLRKAGHTVHWIGIPNSIEARVVPAANFSFHTIDSVRLRGQSIFKWPLLPFQVIRCVWQAHRTLQALKPACVLGMGGFVAGPVGIAAFLQKIPLVIHEQNAIAGLSNQWLARVATRVLTGFPHTFAERYHPMTVGNPVRENVLQLPAPALRFHDRKNPMRLLVLGGSLGARHINKTIPAALALLNENERPVVWHQTGERFYEETRGAYQSLMCDSSKIIPFIDDMAAAYAWADVVCCRAGALTLSELAAVGLGSILVPYPHAVDDHQTANAQFLTTKGAALLCQEKDFTPSTMAEHLRALQQDRSRLLTMAQAAYDCGLRTATEEVARYCQEIAHA